MFHKIKYLTITFCLLTIISCKIKAVEVKKGQESCSITWRHNIGEKGGASDLHSYAYFYNGKYVGKMEHGLEVILKKISNFKGEVVYIEVPYAKNINDVALALAYPSFREIPFFEKKENAIKFINALKSFQVVFKFDYSKVYWNNQKYNSARTFTKGCNRKITQNIICTISWQKMKNNHTVCILNGKNVGVDEVGLSEILSKIKSFEGNILYIKFPHINHETNPSLISDDYYSIPFFYPLVNSGDGEHVSYMVSYADDFIALIKSKGITVKLVSETY